MKKTKATRNAIMNQFGIPAGEDFDTLRSTMVEKILEAANASNYRAPRNANGSRARYFYAYLNR